MNQKNISKDSNFSNFHDLISIEKINPIMRIN